MSSATSTDPQALQPWQLFTLAGLVGATVVVFMSRGESAAGVILLSLTIFAAAAVGVAALRTFVPLAGGRTEEAERPNMRSRSRAALEREKAMVLRSIKEVEFDRSMGKISEQDFAEMSARLRARAARLMRELDAGAGYREAIEREVARRLAASTNVGRSTPADVATHAEGSTAHVPASEEPADRDPPSLVCSACDARNDADARFCKRCGGKLGTVS